MRSSVLPAALLSVLVSAESHEWQAPKDTDSRAPCPMLNTIANHGYVPRDGRNVSLADLQDGFTKAINLDPDFIAGAFSTAVLFSTTGRADTLNLHDVLKLEHDASLSRLDAYFGDARRFDDGVWAQVNASYGADVVTVEQVAASRLARIATCEAENPVYNLTEAGAAAGWGEAALFLLVMGNDKTTGDAPRDYVEIFFQQERLPIEEGWTRPDEVTTTAEINVLTGKMTTAAGISS